MLRSYVTLYWDICCKQVFSLVVNKNEFSIIPIFFPAAHFNRSFLLRLNATCTSPIMHLICSPKFCITFVFSFLMGITVFSRKLKTMLLQKFWGANKVHYGKCASGVLATVILDSLSGAYSKEKGGRGWGLLPHL